jgi:hypothetical protein
MDNLRAGEVVKIIQKLSFASARTLRLRQKPEYRHTHVDATSPVVRMFKTKLLEEFDANTLGQSPY